MESSPLFTSVVSRQEAAAQEVTTFSRGLSLRESQAPLAFAMQTNSTKHLRSANKDPLSASASGSWPSKARRDVLKQKNSGKLGQAAPAKVALAAESESKMRPSR